MIRCQKNDLSVQNAINNKGEIAKCLNKSNKKTECAVSNSSIIEYSFKFEKCSAKAPQKVKNKQ